jgi:hypothetical protein
MHGGRVDGTPTAGSLWMATCAPMATLSPLYLDVRADIVVIGAGGYDSCGPLTLARAGIAP